MHGKLSPHQLDLMRQALLTPLKKFQEMMQERMDKAQVRKNPLLFTRPYFLHDQQLFIALFTERTLGFSLVRPRCPPAGPFHPECAEGGEGAVSHLGPFIAGAHTSPLGEGGSESARPTDPAGLLGRRRGRRQGRDPRSV